MRKRLFVSSYACAARRTKESGSMPNNSVSTRLVVAKTSASQLFFGQAIVCPLLENVS